MTRSEKLKDEPAPTLSCPECPNDDLLFGEKVASDTAVKRWYDCPDCGYEAISKLVYPLER
jgi:predicted RNA-binding Zn-ribbon protein involved in translation (DUF1610 family)